MQKLLGALHYELSGITWYIQLSDVVEQCENKGKEAQTPITSGLFPLASPLFSPLLILDSIVIFTLENLLADYILLWKSADYMV